MKYIKPAVSKPAIGNRAAEPLTTDELLDKLGYNTLPPVRRHSSDHMPRFRRSGGKRGGYCPMPS